MSASDLVRDLPFANISDDEFLSLFACAPRTIPMDLETLDAMTFDVFDFDDEGALDELNDVDPDLCLYNQLSNQLNSQYYTTESFKKLLSSPSIPTLPFGVYHSNIRGLICNRTELLGSLSEMSFMFPVICLSETWLNSNNKNSVSLPGYRHESRVRPKKLGGGVSIFIRDHLPYSARNDLSQMKDECEAVFIEIDRSAINARKNVIVGCIYRPPKTNADAFNESMRVILENISRENKHVFLSGDFNLNLLNAGQHLLTSTFVETLFSHSLFPAINKPTRITSSSATLIDNIFANPLSNHSMTAGILTQIISDHCPVFIITSFHCNPTDVRYVTKRSFNDRNKQRFHNTLASTDWGFCLSETDSQCAFSNFYETFTQCFDRCFPLKQIKIGYSNRLPWLSEGLKMAIKRKNALYRKFMKSKLPADQMKYGDYKCIASFALCFVAPSESIMEHSSTSISQTSVNRGELLKRY
jgi:hypothetical protein